MRSLLLGLLLAVLLPGQALARPCATEGRTIAASEDVRVYQLPPDGFVGPTYACPLRGGPRLRLGSSDVSQSGPAKVRVAADRVFFTDTSYHRATGDIGLDVRVVDVSRRRTQHRWRFYEAQIGGVAADLSLRGAHLAPDGSVAFLVGGLYPDHRYEVHRADSTGRSRVDAGADLDPTSLAVGRGGIHWIRGGTPRRAPFAPGRARFLQRPAQLPSRHCRRRGAFTAALSAAIRVYALEDPDGDRYRACWLRTGRTSWLPSAGMDFSGARDFLLAGRHLLYASSASDRYYGDRELGVRVLDVRTGETRAAWHFSEVNDEEGTSLNLQGAALQPDGRAAVLVGRAGSRGAKRYEVHRVDARGTKTLLDSGPDIAPDSFAAGRDRVYWSRAGIIRTAPAG
ncbi:MAG: hypothetical protein M3P50_10980 [Actinomycetota bacterium]|nr:hypothetical protein [Actinomycetota bacterium]